MTLRKILTAAACALLLFACAQAETAKDITNDCAFRVSEGSAAKITDTSISTGWVPDGDNPEMMIRLPDGGASFVQVSWYKPAANFEVRQYDANQNLLSSATQTAQDSGFLANVFDVTPGAKYFAVSFRQESQGVNKVRVYGAGELPSTVVRWKQPHEDCDLMVISTHMDDEWLWFGGIIPYYDTVLGMKVQVVYMTDCGRLRHGEAMNALGSAGVDTYPVFLELKDERIDSLSKTLQHWGGQQAVTDLMADLIRRFKPEVILTHDWDGEYGHNQHILTSRCMETVIAAAADPGQCPDSYAKYGAWQVQKLYRHLEEKCPIEFDWHVAYPELGGRTLLQTATDAMEENASQIEYFQVKDHGTYDNAKFGLSYSTVGDDVLHEDLFENVTFSDAATGEISDETPDEASSDETPGEISTEIPAEASSDEASGDISTEIPAETTSDEASGEISDEIPAEASSDEVSGEISDETPGEISNEIPAETTSTESPAGISLDPPAEPVREAHSGMGMGLVIGLGALLCAALAAVAVFALRAAKPSKKRRKKRRRKAPAQKRGGASGAKKAPAQKRGSPSGAKKAPARKAGK